MLKILTAQPLKSLSELNSLKLSLAGIIVRFSPCYYLESGFAFCSVRDENISVFINARSQKNSDFPQDIVALTEEKAKPHNYL